MASQNKVAASAMDLATRSIDLVAVIAKSSGLVAQIAQEIIAWRNREGIDERQLNYALRLAQNVCHPNDNGNEMLDCLKTKASELYSLQLIVPGAIGRSILADDSLCWLATTHAVLFKYHDLKRTTDVLCDLCLAKQVGKTDGRRPVYIARIRPVIEKAVESIAMHTTNLGQGVAALPPQLQELPRHFGQTVYFAEVLHTISEASESDLLLSMNRCLTDLLDWVYNHWSGELEVTYVSKILFRKRLGDSRRHLKFVVTEACSPTEDCEDLSHQVNGHVSILANVWPKSLTAHEPLWEGHFGFPYEQQHKGWRADLYDLDFRFSRLVRLNEKEILCVRKNAQEVIRSIMAMPVTPTTDSSSLALQHSKAAGAHKLQWWMGRTPGLLQPNYGSRSNARELYKSVDDVEGDVEMGSPVSSAGSATFSAEAHDIHDQERNFGERPLIDVNLPDPSYDLTQLQRDYPELVEIGDLAGDRCECGCRRIGETVTLKYLQDEGCLRILGVFSALVLIGHALADALGLRDLSNLKSKDGPRNVCEATIIILSQIASRGQIRWRHWFRLVGSAATGLEHDLVDKVRPRVNGADDDFGGEHVAWTCGSMTVVPSWFNIGDRQELHRSWSVKVLTGKPDSLTADRAILETQSTTRVQMSDPDEACKVTSHDHFPASTLQTSAFTSIIASEGPLHRIMTLINTESSLRILDPADIFRGYMHAIRPQCKQEYHHLQAHPVYLRTLDDVLQCWSLRQMSPKKDGPELYSVGGDRLGYNIALALSCNDVMPAMSTVLQTEGCCLTCALKEAHDRRAMCVTRLDSKALFGSNGAKKAIPMLPSST